VAALCAYAVWSQHRLERQLVGTWALEGPHSIHEFWMDLLPDGEMQYRRDLRSVLSRPPVFWSISGQEMITSDEPQRLYPALWPLAQHFGWRPNGLYTQRYELTGDRLTIFYPNGEPHVYSRVPKP
jgi:hypothetical protein